MSCFNYKLHLRWIFPAIGLFTVFPTAIHAADCNDQPISGSSFKDEIAVYLKDNLAFGSICSGQWPPLSPLSATYNANMMFFKRTRTSPDSSANYCNDAFTNIIEQCVLGEGKWGGQWQLDGQYYDIVNSVYPGNGIVMSDAASTISSVAASPSPPKAAVTPTPAPVGNAGNSPPGEDGSTTLQPGPFTTNYVSGVTANTVTATKLSDQSSSTLLPIWFCPGCDAAAAGILVIPLGVTVAGGWIPPPPGFPALSVGPDANPTPVGDPSPGEQPTGDPRTTKQPESSATSIFSTTSSTTSTSEAGEPTACSNDKRAIPDHLIKLPKREVVYVGSILAKRDEIELAVRNPLRSALQAMGGPQAMLAANNLKLVLSRLPKDSKVLNAFVTGLEGYVTSTTKIYNGKKIVYTLREGEFFRIRWDWDPSKGVHVNAEFGERAGAKIAFKPDSWKISPNHPEQYERAVQQQSQRLNYNSLLYADTTFWTPEQRTGRPNLEQQQAALRAMAKELAQEWDRQYTDCNSDASPT